MSREVMVPVSVVQALIKSQNDFNAQLVDKLGLHLERASEAYKDALNPPLESSSSVPMSYSSQTDETEDLLYQLESGQLRMDEIPDSVRKLLSDTDLSVEAG